MRDSIWLRVIQINDVYELENLPHFKTLVEANKEGPDKTLIVLAGDFLAPSLLSSLDKGRGMVDVLNKCDFTHVSIGNHETDVPSDALAQRIAQSNFVWLNTNMRELDEKIGCHTNLDDVIEVKRGDYIRKVALIGVLTEDSGLYRPGAFANAKIEPVLETTERYLEQVPAGIDLVLPLTHQRMPEDRAFATKFTGDAFPVVLGGHDHEPYDETLSGSRIIKTGMDGQNTAIIDIKWSIDGEEVEAKPCVEVEMIPTKTFAADPKVKAIVDAHERILEELEKAKLFRPADWARNKEQPFSTKDNRIGFSTGSQALVSMIRMGMRADCGIINAGSIRGNKVYDNNDWFTWADLKAEIPFPTEMTAVRIPGQVLEATIAHSREGARNCPPISTGGYIQTCNQIEWNYDTWKIDSIRGKPFHPDAMYLTSLPIQFFAGIDNHAPLLAWAKDQPCCQLMDNESGRPAKMVIAEVFSSLIWLEMGSFDLIDTNGDGELTRDEVWSRVSEVLDQEVADLVVDNIMSIADADSGGTITPLEMMMVRFVATDMIDHICSEEELKVMKKVVSEVLEESPSQEQVKQLLEAMDLSGDGKINREEAIAALGDLKNQSLLR